MKPSSRPDSKRRDIQALRAFAVLAVVIYHFFPSVLPAGFVGVDVFFVISGFLITSHLLRDVELSGRVNFALFYARRIKRILPSAYVVLAITVVAVLALLPVSRWGQTGREGLASIFYVQNIYLAKQSVDYLAEGSSPSVFQHFWSLAVEEQFYIVIPLLLAAIAWASTRVGRRDLSAVRRTSGVWISVLAAASLAYSQWQVATGDASAYFVLTSRFWELALGSILAVLALEVSSRLVSTGLAVTGWVGLGAAAIFTPVTSFPGVGALGATVATSLVIVAGCNSSRWLAWSPVQHIGDVSYNLYLTHWPILIVLGVVLPQPAMWVTLLAIIGSYGAAVVLYRWIDRPLAQVKVTAANTKQIMVWAVLGSLVVAAICLLPLAFAHQKDREEAARIDRVLNEHFDELGGAVARSQTYETFTLADHLILPAPHAARDVLPSGAEGRCKSKISADFTPTCEFGSPDSSTVIALVGDSHIEQYLPAFELLAHEQGWLVRTYFKASCPFSAGQRTSDTTRGSGCLKANEKTLQTLLADGSIDLVVTSNRTDVQWVLDGSVPSPQKGFEQYWNALLSADIPVLVLRDNPKMLPSDATTDCVSLKLSEPQVCALPLAEAQVKDYQIEPAQVVPVTFVETSGWFCIQDQCPAVLGNVLVYRDEQHISVLYAQTLAPSLYKEIAPLLDE